MEWKLMLMGCIACRHQLCMGNELLTVIHAAVWNAFSFPGEAQKILMISYRNGVIGLKHIYWYKQTTETGLYGYVDFVYNALQIMATPRMA